MWLNTLLARIGFNVQSLVTQPKLDSVFERRNTMELNPGNSVYVLILESQLVAFELVSQTRTSRRYYKFFRVGGECT